MSSTPRTLLRPATTTVTPGPAAALAGMAWLTVVLFVDAGADLGTQRLLGLATWGALALVLRAETWLVRMQTAVVVVFATAVEYTFSPWLEVYVYRFDNVPMYVPPGHGLVYLAALTLGRTAWVHARQRMLTVAVVAVGGVWAAHGVWWAERPDVLGAFWFCCLVAFLLWGPSRGVYLGAFVVVSYLEILGTALGTWTWKQFDPTGWISIGNPPSGAAGGYGWFDLVALLIAPRLLAHLSRVTRRRRGAVGGVEGQSLSGVAGRRRDDRWWTEPPVGSRRGSSGSPSAGSEPT